MALFLVAAFATSLLVAMLIFSRPAQFWLLRSARRTLRQFGIARPNRYIRNATVVAYFIVPPLLLIVCIGPLHSSMHPIFTLSQFLLGSWFRRLVLGVIFGVVLPIWAAQLYSHSADKSWPLWLYVETAALGLLFVGGLGDVFSPTLQRVTNIPTPWGALTLASEASRSNTAPGLDPGGLSGSGVNAPHTVGLSTLAQIGSIITRDDENIAALEGHVDETLMTPIADQLDGNIGALARCDQSIHAATGESQFIQDQFSRMAPKLRAYGRTLSYPDMGGGADLRDKVHSGRNAAGLELAEQFVRAAAASTERAFVHNFSDSPIDSDAKVIEQLKKDCAVVAWLPCRASPRDDGQGWSSPGASVEDVKSYCSAICPSGACRVTCRLDDKTDCGPPPQLTGLTREIIDRWAKSTDLAQQLFYRLDGVTDADRDFRRRPYLAIIYADMAEIANEPTAALKEISDWLRTPPFGEDDGDARTKWYRIRAKLVAGDIADEWLSDSVAINAADRQLRLAIFGQIVGSLRGLKPTSDGLSKLSATSTKSEGYETAPEWSAYCRSNSDAKEALKFAYTYVTNAIRYIDLAENDLDHWDGYSVVIEQLLRDMHFDFSCLSLIYPSKFSADQLRKLSDLAQADIRRLEANRIVLEVTKTGAELNADETSTELRKAARIAAIASSLIKNYDRSVSAILPENTSLLDPLSGEDDAQTENNITRTHTRIIDLQKLIASKINGD